MRLTPIVSAAAMSATLLLAACGNDSSSSGKGESAEHQQSTPAVALREVGETRDALSAALATYKKGDKAAAQEQVAEAYVQHFEEVEGPLGKRDAELKEHLEETISGELRQQMKDGTPADEVEASVQAVLADLDKAEALLR